jgi:predicted AlkP superfamily phosphohydrolase/phosphomutase
MKNRTPVVMIGLDAVEMSLVDRLCDEGKLPTLQSLRENGCFGILQSDAHLFAGGVWPTFYTAKQVPWHGIYHNKLWRYEKMRCEVADSEWLPDKPFWEYLNDQQYRIAIVDAPMTLSKWYSSLRMGNA